MLRLFLCSWLYLYCLMAGAVPFNLGQLQVPPGFKISVYAKVPNARQLAVTPNGVVFVGTRRSGKVYAVLPNATMTHSKQVLELANDLFMPNGVAFYKSDLYVAEVNRILRYPNILKQLTVPPKPQVVLKGLPDATHHGWKYLAVSPKGWLYFPIGAPCNICLSKDPRFATIMRVRPDGRDLQTFAKGVRNSVGFDWHPINHGLWFTENGRDWLGDDLPPDELNRAPLQGLHFGYPFVYGNNIPDPKFRLAKRPKQALTVPALQLGAHVAALGMKFYTGKMFPKSYQQQIFIAEHGSWNRSRKIGYRVIAVKLDGNKVVSKSIFAKGWLQGQKVSGRPVDIAQLPDGALLVSDDYAGLIYRISYA